MTKKPTDANSIQPAAPPSSLTDSAKAYFDSLLREADPDMLPEGDVFGEPASSGSFRITSNLDVSAVKDFCIKNNFSESAFFNAVFAYILGKYNLREDVLYVASCDERTFPVFLRVNKEQPIAAFVSEVDSQLTASTDSAPLSYEELSLAYNIPADLIFSFKGELFAPDFPANADKSTTPLRIEVCEKDGAYIFCGTYECSRYSKTYINYMTACLEQAAKEFTQKAALKDVCLADERSIAQMDSFNDTDVDVSATDIVSLFRAAAESHPDNQAVIFKDEVMTYRELDDISERIAGFLRSRGIGKGKVVSILIHRGMEMATATMGVLKAGAAYQPLDPGYPSERLSFMMNDADCAYLIVDEDLLERVPDYKGPVLLTKDLPALPETPKIEDHPDPEDLFILLYTSGTTGVPKGVMLEHKNLVNFVIWYAKYFDLREDGRVGAYASYGFDACMMDLFSPLAAGACVCIIEEEIRLDLVAIEDWYNRLGITHSLMTTQVGRQFYTFSDFPSLKCLLTGGEKLVPLAPREDTATKFYNCYGPTECTILSTTKVVDKLYNRVPIGKPLDNYKCYVVDADMNRLPPYLPGELLVAGMGVGRGYLNRPDISEKAFIHNPFSSDQKYSRAYHTGDVVRLLPDGNIDFIGRSDSQVKVRGFRIELTEVEGVIREFPGITDATVQTFTDETTGETSIAAYVVSDSEVDVSALDEFIKERKPAYMVPSVTMQLDAIPLNQNSKVNKRALPKPEMKLHADAKSAAAAPLNVLEQGIKEILDSIVSATGYGITDRFADLGLSSISSIRLAMEIHKKYNVQLDARKLLAEGSIQSVENEILGSLLENGKGSADITADVPPEEVSGKTAEKVQSCRLSFAQQGLYTEYRANPDTVQYNIPFAVKLPEGITAEQLENAVRKIVDAHPYILCRFVMNADDEVIQEPIPDCRLEIPVREMSVGELEKYKNDFVRPFDLAKGPAVRFEIIKADSLTLLVDMHHLISDGATMDLFFSQLCRALDGGEIEKEDYTYYEFARDEKITPEVESFFAEQMASAEEATRLIPDIFEEGLPHTEKTVSTGTDIAAVKEYARRAGVTPAAVYLAACNLTFGRYVCEDTAAIATISNGRSNLKIMNTMGMFVNTLPLVISIDHKENVADYLHRTAKVFSDTIGHENYPFALIAGKYDFHPSISYAYQIGVINEYTTKCGQLTVEGLHAAVAKIPVSIFIEGTEEEAQIAVTYDSALYSEAMMNGLAVSIEHAVRGLLTSETLAGISLTGEAEWKVLDSFNRPWDLDFDKNDTAVTCFKRTAAQQPDKLAAVYKDKTYTYRKLDELTDRLAAKIYLKASQAAGKDDLAEEVAAILLPRDENVFLLPLAAIKAGMAYEPLDPSYPKERLNFMVKDAGVCLLIAEDSLMDHVDEYEGPVLTTSELFSMDDAPQVPKGPSPEDLFVMLYTSGSTGLPKGCQIEHRNLVSYAHGVRNDFYTKDDRIAAYASFGFDVNMSDVFCTLLNGGTVYLIPEDMRMNLGALAGYFDEVGITALLLTTQVGVQFLEGFPQLKTLRMLVMGGEKLPAVDPSKLSYTIVNGYGPTENCCGVSLFPIKSWEPNIPIGKPMATIHGYVLDRTGHRLPAGAAGEYCLSGPQVSRGYLNRPEKTAEAYEACPFNEFRMYHTGDIVRYRLSGDVEFVGRKDGQVKIRGFRIETKEVESVIRGFAGIRDVTFQPYDYEGGGKYLAAFVVSDSPVDIAQLTEYIKSQKPAYMVPAVIMQIDKIPLTVNQKVDKKALPEPKLQKAEYVAPQGKIEEDICAIFGSVLGIDRVSAEDDFFDIGGSSILAMKVVAGAEKAGYGIVYSDVFRYPTPRAMAEFLGASHENVSAPAEAPAPATSQCDVPTVGPDGYDYTEIHELLSRSTVDSFKRGGLVPLGDVLLLGGTGYLGSHVLHELILRHDVKIYCFVRPGKDESGEARLKKTLSYYFGDDCASYFGDRICVIEGDATDQDSLMAFASPSENMTVINCAASVKHFARGNEIEHANVDSVKNLTAWCEKNGARLVHISTGSVAGSMPAGTDPGSILFDEHRLYIGQIIDNNQYVHSKFMGERHIYEEMVEHGLRAKVLRMGNLAPRAEDGEFQINYTTNNIMNTFRAFETLKAISYDLLGEAMEFSPIDSLAEAVVAIAQTPDECICFIPLNPHRPLMEDVIRAFNAEGSGIRYAEPEDFAAALSAALGDEKTREAVNSLTAYDFNDNTQQVGIDSCDSTFTYQVLARLGYVWPETGIDYMRQFIRKLKAKGFFGGQEA